MDEATVRDWLTLACLPLSAAALRSLVADAQHPAEILSLPDSDWCRAGADREARRARRAAIQFNPRSRLFRQVESAQRCLEDCGAFLVPLGSENYPPLLSQIYDPPSLLFVRGRRAALLQRQLAIVGSRRCSSSGSRAAAYFARGLVGAGFAVTSGLALGADAAAHRSALAAAGVTIGVVATGIDRCYPKRHRSLAEEICERGVIVTEFLPGAPPRREHFPRRNRIISGMSAGVLVVEAAERSGSLITARLALEQNREVFALPHSLFNPGGRGCHQLIRDGAKLTERLEHILEEVGSLCAAREELLSSLSAPSRECPVWQALGHDAVSVDELVCAGAGTVEVVVATLATLELEGHVERCGGLYQRKV